MRLSACFCVLLLALLVGCGPSTSPVKVTAVPNPPQGWMAGGYGEVKYTFDNRSGDDGKVIGWSCQWEAAGERVGDVWSDRRRYDLPPHQKTELTKVGQLPAEAVEKAGGGNAVLTCDLTVLLGDETFEVPIRIEVPEAVLPEKLVTTKGEYVGIAIMESHDKELVAKDRLLRWLDESYKAMWDLTGRRPYNGEMIIIQESPPQPWYTHAGNPILMDTTYMANLVQEVNAGIMPFGWIQAMGEDFDDGLGEWTIWNGESREWQANWKLDYAYETIPDQSFKAKWERNEKAPYPARGDAGELVSGYQLMQSRFLFFGDGYLGDHDRTWDTMGSGDLHAFFLRLVREYGWEPFKQWYRTTARLDELGYDAPRSPDEKINLIAAILQYHIDKEWYPAYLRSKEPDANPPSTPEEKKIVVVDIVPAFERWRMPVTAGKMAGMFKRYPITDEDAVKPESVEAAAALIKMTIANKQKDGWMRKGWGQLTFTFKNEGELPSKLVWWKAQWIVNGEPFVPENPEDPKDDGVWRHRGPLYLPAGEEVVLTKTGWLDPDMLDQAGSQTPLLRGTIAFKTADLEFEVPWEFEVPEAVMKERLVRVEGKHMAYEITETHYNALGEEGSERLLRWLDEAYEAMVDLTGYTPYGGEVITIVESPPHPYYAYAGNPIIMNTMYMDDLVKHVNDKVMLFGWVHELGHDFDHADNLYGKWYMWSYGASEAQANIKVVYVHEAIADQDWKALWPKRPTAAYIAPVDDMPLDGKDCMDKQFIFNLDGYLADPTIPWNVRFCQHVFLQRIGCVYGWDPVKKWYRTYKIIADQGYERPETPEEKIRLMAAILCETTGVDLVPLFQLWRAPVTYETNAAMKAKYPIEEAVKSIVLPGEETAATN